MTAEEMAETAEACVEMMRTMSGMMGMHGDPGGMPGMGGMGGSMMAMGGWLGFLVLLLTLIGVAVLLALVWTRRGPGHDVSQSGTALAELDLRYARGEVDRDTYLQVRRDLQEARG